MDGHKKYQAPDKCPKCGSHHIIYNKTLHAWVCLDCGHMIRNVVFLKGMRRKPKGRRVLAERFYKKMRGTV